MSEIKQLKILHLEDNLADQAIFETYIQDFSENIEYHAKQTLADGLSWLANNRVDIVLLDLNLFDTRGIDTLLKLKEVNAEVTIIVLSGNRDLAIAEKAIKNGAQDYLLKGSLDSDRVKRTLLFNIERSVKTKAMQKRGKDLEQFSYMVTHDLKSPLNNLSQLITMFESDQFEKSEFLDLAKASINILNDTIVEFTNVLEFKTQAQQAIKEEIKLKVIAEEVINVHKILIEESGVKVSILIDENHTIIYNKGHLRSIIQNLVSNAIKYRSEENPTIELNSYYDKGKLVFECKDNGLGMDLSKGKDSLFKLFKRFHTDKGIEGKGIGLNMTKSIIEENGGWIDVESEVGVGSVFKVYL